MSFILTYPLHGRGAWPADGTGGTLNSFGNGPGRYYRAPANTSVKMPGLTAALAVKTNTPCSINDYAVYRAVKALQPHFGLSGSAVDGVLGSQTNAAIKAYQSNQQITVDGVIGPQTSEALFKPLVLTAAKTIDPTHQIVLIQIVLGTFATESQYDLGAVGWVDTHDLGIGQINGPAHPDLSVDTRLDPVTAIPYAVNLINNNLKSMLYVQDDAIAAYNLGVGGARSWVKAGRPRTFNGADVWAYISSVKAGASR